MKIMRAHYADNFDVNAFNAMKEELKQLKNQTNHLLANLEGGMSNSTQGETLHNIIPGKNELIKKSAY